jgi:hypothetical protein
MSVTIEDIEALRSILTELPRHQPKEVSKQEAIALLASELGAARRRGYTPDELARILSERGVAINAATLRGYLRRNRSSRRGHENKAATDRRDRTAAPATPTSSAPTAPAPASPSSPPRAPAAGVIPDSPVPMGSQAGTTQPPKAPASSTGPTGAPVARK